MQLAYGQKINLWIISKVFGGVTRIFFSEIGDRGLALTEVGSEFFKSLQN